MTCFVMTLFACISPLCTDILTKTKLISHYMWNMHNMWNVYIIKIDNALEVFVQISKTDVEYYKIQTSCLFLFYYS